MTIAIDRSIQGSSDALTDLRTGTIKPSFLSFFFFFTDPVVWKRRKCYANDLLIPLHYLLHFFPSFSHSQHSEADRRTPSDISFKGEIYLLQLINLAKKTISSTKT